MSLNLYLKTDAFSSNKEMAEYFHRKLSSYDIKLEEPIDQDYMFIINSTIGGEVVSFYLGKNDEECSPPIWQIWPEQRVSFFKKVFGKPDFSPESSAKKWVEEIAKNIDGVSGVEWAV